MNMEQAAVIDIGSNSVRCAYNEAGGQPLKKQSATTRLGAGTAFSPRLDDSHMVVTLDAAAGFALKAKAAGRAVYCFATEAVRSAANRDRFLRMAAEEYGLAVEVLSCEEEALCAYLGAAAAKADCEVVDIGGASTELIAGRDNEIIFRRSFPIGAVRLADLYKTVNDDAINDCRKILSEADRLPRSREFYAVGGTVTALASIKAGGYDPIANHGTVLNAVWLEETAARLAASADIAADYPFLGRKRAFIIQHGLSLLLTVMSLRGYDSVTVSERDNIEGYILYKENFTERRFV